MTKNHPLYFILICLFIIFCQSAIPPNYALTSTASLIPNIHSLGYSHNQRMLVVIEQGLQGAFYVYDGIRLANPQKINIKDENKPTASPSTFAFSKNDSMLVVGTQEGSVFGYRIGEDWKVNQQWTYNMSYGARDQTLTVKSISIDSDGNLVVGARDQVHVLTVPKDNGQESMEFVPGPDIMYSHLVQSVCWSVQQPNVVIVATLGQFYGNFSYFYTNNKTQKSFNTDKTITLALSTDGSMIYKSTIDKDIQVYAYQKGDVPKLITTIPQSNSSSKILLSADGKYIAAEVKGNKAKGWKVAQESMTNLKTENKQQKNSQNLQLSFLLTLDTPSLTLAFSSLVNDLLIIPTTPTSSIPHYTLCPLTTYLDSQQSHCLHCSDNCLTCFTSDTCISCNNDKFIDGDQCVKCGVKLNGCLTCQSQDKCLTCDPDAYWNQKAVEGKCICMNTYYEKDAKCKECNVFLDCFACSAEDYCTDCKNEGNFDPKPVEGKCQCKNSFWLNTTQCIQCSKSIPDCISCTQDGKKCSQCQSDDRKPSPDESKCQCIDYHYEDQTGHCQLCDPYSICIECEPQPPNQCIKCDTTKDRKQKPQNGKCVCQDEFYDNLKGECVECAQAIPDCYTCNSETNCLSCKNQGNFDPKPVEGKCICLSGWILVDKECKLCSEEIVGCKTCFSTTKCQICNEESHFVQTPTPEGKCICQTSYWFDGSQCQLCSTKFKGCDTCLEDGSKCLSCQDPNRSPNEAGTSCDCKQFFYEDTNLICQLCDQKQACVRCNQTDPTHKCFQCDSNKFWNATPSDGVCKCMQGYNEYDGKCVLCKVPGCVECQTQTSCNKCDTTKQFNQKPDHDKCTCIQRTYEAADNSSCLNCSKSILGCKQCSNADDCTLCDQNQHFVPNIITNKCDCMKSYYLKNNQSCQECSLAITKCVECLTMGTTVQCTACQKGWGTSTGRNYCVDCGKLSVGCVDCSDSGHCTKCDEDAGFVLTDNVCLCKEGLYIKNSTCLQCSSAIPGCDACDSDSVCTRCTNQNHFSPTPDTNHKCSCVTGYTLDNKQCVQCSKILGCLECSSTTTCTKCDGSHFFQPTPQKICQCQQSYWLNSTQCQQCSTSIYDCKLCPQDGKQCDQCRDPMRQLNEEKTACECVKFTYEDADKKCQYCDPYQSCVKCDPQGDHKCELCNKDKFWNQKPNQDGKCVCQNGYKEYNNECILCQVTGCTECQQTNTCSQCSTQNRFNQQPVSGRCQCQADTILSGEKCYYCSQKLTGCMTCINLTECQKCYEDQFFVLNQKIKQCQCDPQHYLVVSTCKPCSQGIKYCQTCSITETTKQCLKCKKGFEPSQDHTTCLNCEDLIVGCVDCEDMHTCQECDDERHFIFNDQKTQCICDKEYFLKDKNCVECYKNIKGCVECTADGKECNMCNGGEHFVIDEDNKTCNCMDGYFFKVDQCLNCSTLLKGCQKCSQDGSKCLACEKGYFLQRDQCTLCSDPIPGCTSCSNDGSSCQQCNTANFIRNQDSGKCQCIATYFLNVSECSLCDSKFIGCNLCNTNECQECKPEHFVFNNQTKECLCEDGYFVNATQRKCALCSAKIAGCDKCSEDGEKCKECNDTEEFVIDNTTEMCLCKQGYFLEEQQCSLCSSKTPGCTRCSQQGTDCSSCNEASNFVYNQTTKLCQCKQSYFVSSNTQCKLCSEAITYCDQCSTSTNGFSPQCTTCKPTFDLSPTNQSCLCSGSDKEVVDNQCVDKAKINWILYGGIGAGVLVLIGVGVGVYIKWKKAKSRVSLEEEYEESDRTAKRSKQETLLTSENNSAGLLRSSGSLDIDQ